MGLELLSISLALGSFAAELRGRRLIIHSDNSGAEVGSFSLFTLHAASYSACNVVRRAVCFFRHAGCNQEGDCSLFRSCAACSFAVAGLGGAWC